MNRPMSATAATQIWTHLDLICQSCHHTTRHGYPGKKPQRALRRLSAEAQRAPCQNCNAKNWKPA